ncbi:hypothetical protein MML48_1g04027 [Holotrichia oblita]|uniref:Uncharacterized protein n=1 Tax=Holotrichia oblita TaxID=644536 RepID=A0ACB9TVW0_HOLOL|nr:hypothetical protein MML48_1g04027 [Holotrichia oblita]
MSTVCNVCNKDVSPDKDIMCDLCRLFVHSTCGNVTRQEAQCLKVKDRRVVFYCPGCRDFKAQLGDLHALKVLVHDLRKDIDALRAQATPRAESEVYGTESIIQEVIERDRRKNNIIIFNVPEEKDGGKENQVASDEATARRILTELDVSLGDIKPIRLGKFDRTKLDRKRPIKLTFPDNNRYCHENIAQFEKN